MNYKGYGKENRDVIILLHGGGLSCWNYREEAETLQNKFHVIIPILDEKLKNSSLRVMRKMYHGGGIS